LAILTRGRSAFRKSPVHPARQIPAAKTQNHRLLTFIFASVKSFLRKSYILKRNDKAMKFAA